MKPPRDTSNSHILFDASLNKQGEEERGRNDNNASVSALDAQELLRKLKLGIAPEAFLIELDKILAGEKREETEVWRQTFCVTALRHFVRAQVGDGPITEVLSDIFFDLLDKTRAGNVRTGAADWSDRALCIWALIALEEFMDPAEALNHLLSKKKVVALIGTYQRRDGKRVVDHGPTVKKWRKQLEAGATGHPVINELYAEMVVEIRERMENLTKREIRRWADGLLARLP